MLGGFGKSQGAEALDGRLPAPECQQSSSGRLKSESAC
jgi:hypothetical protein